jgi:hypothetical protein
MHAPLRLLPPFRPALIVATQVFAAEPSSGIVDKKSLTLGTIRAPELRADFASGDDDGKTLYLYMAARSRLYRVSLAVPGIRP